MHSGPFVDTMADYIAVFVLIFVPALLLYVFWMIHILPEKIAEQRHHPQADAIKTLCLLSLVFGGMLWPLAWLWAYSKPVLHTMAYGPDVRTPAAPLEGRGTDAGTTAGDTSLIKAPAAAPRS
jgi:hypothetical protein